MIKVARHASDEEVREFVLDVLNVLARGRFEEFGAAVGYSFGGGEPADCVKQAIASYRSPEYYPNEDVFSVTDWRNARGGNPDHRCEVTWYEPNAPMLAGAVTVDLPLNGKWSDLQADFVLVDLEPNSGLELHLEEIYSWRQRSRESVG